MERYFSRIKCLKPLEGICLSLRESEDSCILEVQSVGTRMLS